jgi:opine dehydrogenase
MRFHPAKPVLAICGAGNAGHALVVAASEHFDGSIVWLTSSDEKAAELCAGVFSREGLTSTGAITGRASKVRAISSQSADIIPQADIVIIAVPAFGHASIMRRIGPYLKPSAIVGAAPARGGFEFEAMTMLCGAGERRTIFGLQTLPWSTRVQQIGKSCNFGAIKAQVLMAAMPVDASQRIAPLLSKLFGTKVVPTTNFLNMTLGNPGQVIHPGLMYTLFAGKNERFSSEKVPYFYRDTTDEAGAFIEQLSGDVCAVARAVQNRSGGAIDLSGVWPVLDWLRHTYPTQTRDTATAATCFRTGPLQHRKVPSKPTVSGLSAPDFHYRYMTEDVPFGLVVTKGFAELAHVGTPAIDAVLRWAQRKLNVRYIRNGKLDMAGVYALPVPQNYGFASLDALVQWYSTGAPLARTSASLTA